MEFQRHLCQEIAHSSIQINLPNSALKGQLTTSELHGRILSQKDMMNVLWIDSNGEVYRTTPHPTLEGKTLAESLFRRKLRKIHACMIRMSDRSTSRNQNRRYGLSDGRKSYLHKISPFWNWMVTSQNSKDVSYPYANIITIIFIVNSHILTSFLTFTVKSYIWFALLLWYKIYDFCIHAAWSRCLYVRF